MADCTKTYTGVDAQHRDLLLQNLKAQGADVSGSNPYDVDTHQSGVKLHAEYDEGAQTLTVTITDKPFVASCGMVWDKIDPAVQTVLAQKIVGGGSDADILKGIAGNTGGDLAPDAKKAFSASLAGLGKLPSDGKTDQGKAITKTSSSGAPVASAAGVVDWVVGHPLPTAAIVAVLGFAAWKLWKK